MAIYIFLAEGFEEVEALLPSDFFYRSGIEVKHVGVGVDGASTIRGSHNIHLHVPYTLDDVALHDAEVLFLPGGLPGAKNLAANKILYELIHKQLKANKIVAAICAAPAYVLGDKGLLKGRRFTGYPGSADHIEDAYYISDEAVVQDGNIITSQGIGTASHLAFKIISILKGEQMAQKVWRETLCHVYHTMP